MKNLNKLFNNKRILVTGGTGSIGSEIVKQLFRFKPKQIRVYSRDESKQFFLEKELEREIKKRDCFRMLIGDIRDRERLDRAFEDIDIVFHTAALKHVPFCEMNPFEAVKTNVYGTQNVIDLAIKHRVERMVAISSDKAVYPNTFMGVTKLMMERMVTSAWNYAGRAPTKFSVVRFGNVLNSRGSVIPVWLEQIKKGGPVTVTDKNMKRFFMSIPDAVSLVFLACAMMLGNEIFVLKMPEYNIFELAQKTIAEYGNGKKIKIKITGVREKEKMIERLFTDEEQEMIVECGRFYVISSSADLYKKHLKIYKQFSKI
jgi:FlaA1/EpsC-like NDP-sugar epimerase